MTKALHSFPRGSAEWPDGLRPQHLLDMTSMTAGAGGELLLHALKSFTNFVLSEETHEEIRPLFFGASSTALNKKEGGVRPTAVSCTLHGLVAKITSKAVTDRIGSYLSPLQLGYGTPLGVEAASIQPGSTIRTYLLTACGTCPFEARLFILGLTSVICHILLCVRGNAHDCV